jgi:hypothetical protein
MQLAELVHDTPSSAVPAPAFGFGSVVQTVPFQLWARACSTFESVTYSPTATQLVELTQDTAIGSPLLPRSGLLTTFHPLAADPTLAAATMAAAATTEAIGNRATFQERLAAGSWPLIALPPCRSSAAARLMMNYTSGQSQG